MLLLWLGVFAAAVSPELHLLLHSDARSANHNCVVAQVSGGSVLVGSAPVAAPLPLLTCAEVSAFAANKNFSSFEFRFSPSRAPPSASKL